ncbi:polysaccharide biosynthesis/export family protein [Sphingomonas segetis]|uniref:polysaccharide biosynthesis/export family protein n=1 Tax=Sphingomonas segetis TaxID=1104779 RepID=UPI0012D34259|nr:polysaccharide biosynthesis/export family protein [Sphingomonas segetis]
MVDSRVSAGLFVALLAAAALSLSGCADTRGGSIPYGRVLAAPDEAAVRPLAGNYKIAPLDKLTIKVFKAEELSGDYDVDLAGHISLPLVGEVEAANLTTAELDDRLTEALGQKYFEHPDVSVAIKESTAHVVTVDGAVKQAGQYAVNGPMTLIQAVASARGTSEDANPRRVAVFRTIGGQRQAAAFDLTAIRRGESPDPQIYPGDIVVVDGSRIKEVQKQILQSVPLLGLFGPVL